MKKVSKTANLKEKLHSFVKMNSKEYILVILIFLIGLFMGVMVVNNSSYENLTKISNYLLNFIDKFKNIDKMDNEVLIIDSIKKNIGLTVIIYLAGTTIIGLPIVLGLILFRGFCLGLTISSICYTFGLKNGIIFSLSSLFLQNIFFIPAILTLGVSSIKLYKSIVGNKEKESIKLAILRHTIISVTMLLVLTMSSFIENEISIRLLNLCKNFF